MERFSTRHGFELVSGSDFLGGIRLDLGVFIGGKREGRVYDEFKGVPPHEGTILYLFEVETDRHSKAHHIKSRDCKPFSLSYPM